MRNRNSRTQFRCLGLIASKEMESISYLSQREAAEVDDTLMGPLGFSVDQLMVNLYAIIAFIFDVH